MGLVRCPDCGGSVSTSAAVCPACGCPMGGRLNPVHSGRVVTTEATGKGLKLQHILATLTLIAGVTMLMVGVQSEPAQEETAVIGGLVAMFALGWLVLIRFLRWWRHG